jgi:putative PIG3 family NAD(P)H quinone oxidoreductase
MLPETHDVIAITEAGGPEVLRAFRRPLPEIGEEDVLIKVGAAGINRHDVGQRKGGPKHASSDVPGLEVSGEIVAKGSRVYDFKIGDLVCALTDGGGYAEYAKAPASNTLPRPEGFTDLEAATLPEALFTTWYNIFSIARAEPGDRILIHGGTSGVATIAIQLLTSMGFEVYVTCGEDRKCDFAKGLGATLALNYRTFNFVDEIKRATGRKGVDVVIDMSGGAYPDQNLEAIAFGGVIIHLTPGSTQFNVPLSKLMAKSAWITGTRLRPVSIFEKADMAKQIRAKVWPLLGTEIKPIINTVFPLLEAADAHRLMETNAHIGKILLKL